MKLEKSMFVVILIFGLKMTLITKQKDFLKLLEILNIKMLYVNLLPGLGIHLI